MWSGFSAAVVASSKQEQSKEPLCLMMIPLRGLVEYTCTRRLLPLVGDVSAYVLSLGRPLGRIIHRSSEHAISLIILF